jgi:putative membrane protein
MHLASNLQANMASRGSGLSFYIHKFLFNNKVFYGRDRHERCVRIVMKNSSIGSFLFLGLAAVFLTNPAHADVTTGDKTFMIKAAQGGMTEVQLGQLAAEKGSSQEIKDFGAKMVTDHGKANDELKSIASSKGITLSDKLDAKHQSMVDKMSAMSGPAFDKAYVAGMVKAHKMDDALFTKEASSGIDAEIKAFAGKTDEVVKMHLTMIQDIQSKMK